MKKKTIFIIIALVIVIAAICAAIFIISSPKEEKVKENSDPPSTIKVDDPEEKVKITFDSDGGTKVNAMTIKKGESIDLPKSEKDGYNLLGWYLDGKKIEDGYIFEQDATLVAKWEAQEKKVETFTVTFDSKGGSKVNKVEVQCGKTLKMPKNPTKEGYTFVRWEDKNEHPVYNDAKLYCENVTLYAVWEKNKEYTCPSGYKLSGTKCTTEGTVHEVCPSDTKADGALCIRTSDNNTGTRQCLEDTVSIDGKGHTWTGRGDYYFFGNSYGKCAYYKWENINNQADCTQNINRKATWVAELNGCYAETKMNNYETVCSDGYQYYSTSDLSSKFGIQGSNGKCLRKVDKVKNCDSGYTLTGDKCIKTIDATLK